MDPLPRPPLPAARAWPRRTILAWSLAIGLLAATLALALLRPDIGRAQDAASPGDTAIVYYMGDTGAYLEVCGCSDNLMGGYNRLAGYLEHEHGKAGAWVLLDAGNFLADDDDLAGVRARYALEILARLRPAALNLGARDLVFGEALLLAGAGRELPFVAVGRSTTGLAAEGAEPLAVPGWRLVDAGGLALGVIGVGIGAGSELLDKDTAIAGTIAAAAAARAAGARALILLCACDAEIARAAAAAAGGVSVILMAEGGRSETPIAGEGGPLLTPGEKVHHVAQLSFARATGALAGVEWILLDRQVDPHRPADLQARIADYYAETEKLATADSAERSKLANEGLPVPYAGSKACQVCHAAVYDKWIDDENHFKAFRIFTDSTMVPEALRKRPTPQCVVCHVVGFRKLEQPGQPPRFVWFQDPEQQFRVGDDIVRQPGHVGVGCEVCHGPGGAHVATGARADIHRGSVLTAREEICVKCHVPDHSPDFDYIKKGSGLRKGDYLARIRHWDIKLEEPLRSGKIPVPDGPPTAVPGKTLGSDKKSK